jgi:hypothetical protein
MAMAKARARITVFIATPLLSYADIANEAEWLSANRRRS